MGFLDDMVKAGVGIARNLGQWAVGSDDDVPMHDMHEALVKAGIAEPTEEKPRALFYDPYSITDWGGWRQRPSNLTYETLRQMTMSVTPVTAILGLRTNQIARFARPQQGPYDAGYRCILRDRRDKNRSMTKAEKKKAMEIERLIETTGLLLPDEKPSDRDSFRTFTKKYTRDILTYDQACYEKIRDRAKTVSRFIMLPSETIRPAVADFEHQDVKERHERVSHVQVFEESIIAEFSPDDIAWNIMNPRTDLRANGFGLSPVEQMTRLVSSWLFGFEYNQKFFTQGSAIKGILNVKGAIPDRQLRAFRRMWYAMVTGVGNAWKTPILNSEDIQWVSMHSTNREMEYAAWMDWLTKLICAIYGIDPLEINFVFSGQGTGGSAMFDKRPNESEVTESKDKGLRPLVEHMTDSINQHLVWEWEPDFEFSFVGLDAKAEEKEREARLAEIKATKTVNEVRAEMDEKPLPEKLGDVILDPTWLQWAMSQQQQPAMPGGEEDQQNAIDDDDDGEYKKLLMTKKDIKGGDEEDDQDVAEKAAYSFLDMAGDLLRKSRVAFDDLRKGLGPEGEER